MEVKDIKNIGIALGGGKAFGVPSIAVIIAFFLVFCSGIVFSKRTQTL
ncbi:hypothetical protein [Desulfosporosinus hippei]|nr:hypothetical protein [Desulfosporosinus hippei]